MRNWIVCILVGTLAACCRSEPVEQVQCSADTECVESCVGYDHAICSAKGVCVCSDSIPVVKQKCQSATDCACSSGTASCGLDGICYCATETEVQVPKACASVSDCACPEGYGLPLCAADGLCYCGEPAPVVKQQCQSATDCACSSGTASCGLDGICYCATETEIQVPKACASVTDCSCPQGYGDPLCGVDGMCYCNQVQVVEVGACAANTDCACSSGTATCGTDGLCYCATIVSAPTECPAITRQEFVLRMYTALDLDCAQPTCTDVNGSCAWGALEKAGIVSAASQCLPNNTMTRAEVTKLVITADDGLADYEAPLTPTFTDVPTDAWYYDFIEAATQLGLPTGYLDSSGNYTGLFGPGNWASTCWAQELIYQGVKPGVKPEPKVVLVNSGPASFITSTGSVGVIPLSVAVTSNADLTVMESRLEIRAYDGNRNPVTDLSVFATISNIKIVDIDSGATIAGPVINAGRGERRSSGSAVWVDLMLSEDYELVGGETRHLAVVLDVDSGFYSGYRFTVSYSLRPSDAPWTTFIKDWVHNLYLDATQLTGDPVVGNEVQVQAPGLWVFKGSNSLSGWVIQGTDNLDILDLSFTTGINTIMVKKIAPRAYADNLGGADFSATGDRAANSVIASLSLYEDGVEVKGPVSVSLVDLASNNFTPDADWYKALFDNLAIAVPANSTKTLMVRAKLLNALDQPVYIAPGLDPAVDIVAEDAAHNSVVVQGQPINMQSGGKNPEITVLPSGSLDINAQNCPPAANVAPGAVMQLASKYQIPTRLEAFTVNKLTIVNVPGTASFLEANAVDTIAVDTIAVKYADVNGVWQTRIGQLLGGKVTFSGLDMSAPVSGTTLEVYATVRQVGPGLIGSKYRLGVVEDNSISTFDAVGKTSSRTVMPTSVSNAGVGEFTVQ